ncbi:MAG TPA: NADH-quinone oxidoreductase subunit NuoG, partial [Rhodocyclaceae bacterium]|nr:NADH-quinone oxidoreductase subunit NuoG [Rhodocyclaceae bacterium]
MPVAENMVILTDSEKARKARKGVMEFLLINHPLDCPICDQGGECQLQDLAVGYGASGSRYQEEKRVVFNKNLGPLISTDMTRCIHCTRCVRFGQEVAGIMELGMAGRGEHSEILSFVGRTVDSELSGNVIDICPVGALTSKPFRFSARTWEMARRKSVSPHDSLGSNLIVQVKNEEVKRVLPLENEELNECWLSDKDRFSYEGLAATDRLTTPMIKQGGTWQEVDWQTALSYAADALKGVASEHGSKHIGALISPHSTLEELYLAQKFMRGMGSGNVDFRLRQSDFSLDGKRAGVPWLGMPVAQLNSLDAVLVIGSFLRKDHPLIAHRLRQAVKQHAKLSRIHAVAEDWFTQIDADVIVAPNEFTRVLAEVVKALAAKTGTQISAECSDIVAAVNISEAAQRIAESLATGEKRAVLLGNLAVQHPNFSSIQILAQEIARLTGATLGVIGEAANSVGGYLAHAVPGDAGLNARQMIESPLKAYLLLGVEPALDCANGVALRAAMNAADTVIHVGAFVGDAKNYADVMLPISAFTETSGTFVNAEGRVQSFNAVAKAAGETRPGWKVLRVLGNLLGLAGFEYESSEAVLKEALAGEVAARLNNQVSGATVRMDAATNSLQRIADVPIYFADPLVRRAQSLQKTRDAKPVTARMAVSTLTTLGVEEGAQIVLRSVSGEIRLNAERDDAVAEGCVRVAAAHASTAALGAMFGELSVERA